MMLKRSRDCSSTTGSVVTSHEVREKGAKKCLIQVQNFDVIAIKIKLFPTMRQVSWETVT